MQRHCGSGHRPKQTRMLFDAVVRFSEPCCLIAASIWPKEQDLAAVRPQNAGLEADPLKGP